MAYRINEIFYSLQGEGIRQGTANVFIRFSGCNLKCSIDDEHSGFDCDTEFVSGRDYTLQELMDDVPFYPFVDPNTGQKPCRNVILTGGEPALQVDDALLRSLRGEGFYIAIETNGTHPLPKGIDWICVSPKSAEHTLRVTNDVDELKYVRRYGQGIPKPSTSFSARHKLISPAFESDGSLARQTLDWCINLVKENPDWRLSVQQHKLWRIR